MKKRERNSPKQIEFPFRELLVKFNEPQPVCMQKTVKKRIENIACPANHCPTIIIYMTLCFVVIASNLLSVWPEQYKHEKIFFPLLLCLTKKNSERETKQQQICRNEKWIMSRLKFIALREFWFFSSIIAKQFLSDSFANFSRLWVWVYQLAESSVAWTLLQPWWR